MSKPIKSSNCQTFVGRSLLSFWPLLLLSWLPLPSWLLLLPSWLPLPSWPPLLSWPLLPSSWPPLPSFGLFFLLLGLFFTFLSCLFFFDFQFVKFLFFSTITPRHHSASLSFDTVWSRIAWKFWISPLSSWVIDFGLVRCWG